MRDSLGRSGKWDTPSEAGIAAAVALHSGLHPCVRGSWYADDTDYRGSIADPGPCPTRRALTAPQAGTGSTDGSDAHGRSDKCRGARAAERVSGREILAAGESVARIGVGIWAGTPCSFCGRSYRVCTHAVLADLTDPARNDGCCESCRDGSGHTERPLPGVRGLLAEETEALRAERDRYRLAWLSARRRGAVPASVMTHAEP